jgi:hypothetical protein
MSHNVRQTTQGERLESIRSLEALLDYAMLEGAELKLPMLVFLLRVARMELVNSVEVDKKSSSVDEEIVFETPGNGSRL